MLTVGYLECRVNGEENRQGPSASSEDPAWTLRTTRLPSDDGPPWAASDQTPLAVSW
jgi:hypothetical protein